MNFRIGLLDTETFVAELGTDGLTTSRDDIDAVNAVLTTSPSALAAIVYAGVPPATAEADGSIKLVGDRSLAERFTTLFPLTSRRSGTCQEVSGPIPVGAREAKIVDS